MSALENVRALSEAQGRSVKDAEGKPIPDPLAYASAALELAATGPLPPPGRAARQA